MAGTLNACARLPHMNSGVLVFLLANKVKTEGSNYGLPSICLITAGLSSLLARVPALKLRIKSLFEALGSRVGELSLWLEPRQVASLVYSFARVSLPAFIWQLCDNFLASESGWRAIRAVVLPRGPSLREISIKLFLR